MDKRYYAGQDIADAIIGFMDAVSAMKEADVVEVVRCKDCRFFQTDGCRYDWPVQNVNDYCSKGERKEDE